MLVESRGSHPYLINPPAFPVAKWAKPLLIGHSACWADVRNGAEAGLKPATYESQVRRPVNSVTHCGAVSF